MGWKIFNNVWVSGLSFGAFFVVIYFIMFALGGFRLDTPNVFMGFIHLLIFPIVMPFTMGFIETSFSEGMGLLFLHILVFIGFFIWGALIGWIVGKVKERKATASAPAQ